MSNSGLSLVLGRILVDAGYFKRLWDARENNNNDEIKKIALEVTNDLTDSDISIIQALDLKEMNNFVNNNKLPGEKYR